MGGFFMTCLFRLRADGEEHVSLMGDFNNWSTVRTPMERVGDRWEVFVELEPGMHEYAYFAIDESPASIPHTQILCPGSKVVVPGSSLYQRELVAN